MDNKYQRGELSLFWAAILVGVVALGAMVALLSMRHERNLFGEAWQRVTHADVAQSVQSSVAEKASKSESAGIRKCLVGGKMVYSNVECDAGNPTSRQVELRDTRGIEPPKAPAASASPADGPQKLQDKMIEKAVQR